MVAVVGMLAEDVGANDPVWHLNMKVGSWHMEYQVVVPYVPDLTSTSQKDQQ